MQTKKGSIKGAVKRDSIKRKMLIRAKPHILNRFVSVSTLPIDGGREKVEVRTNVERITTI